MMIGRVVSARIIMEWNGLGDREEGREGGRGVGESRAVEGKLKGRETESGKD